MALLNSQQDNLLAVLFRATSELQRLCDGFLHDRLGVSYGHVRLLLVVRQRPKILQQELALQLGVTQAAISRQIKELKASRHINVERGKKDARKHHISLSSDGRRLLGRAEKLVIMFEKEVTVALSNSDKRTLLKLLGKL